VGRLRPHITVVGLGPAGAPYLSNNVVALLTDASRSFVRTGRHPAVADLTGAQSFDHLYEASDTFDEVYRSIVEALVAAATETAPDPVVYAVPGSPLVAERTVELLRVDTRVDVTILPGLSFLDLVWERLGIDPLTEGVQLVDAERFVEQSAGRPGPFLVAQCWSRQLLLDGKLSAGSAGEDDLPEVVILHHLGLSDEQIIPVPWWDLDRTVSPDHLTSLYIPGRATGTSAQGEMTRLVDLVSTLRERCPWDRAQTHASLMPHLVEEAYEVLDSLSAIAAPGPDGVPPAGLFAHLEEELGDLLFQVVFHACLAQEEGYFTLADVAGGIHDKLVHRHPHVFGDVDAETPEQVVTNWEAIKKAEKGRDSVTDGIPAHLPALMLAGKLQRKALSVGIDGTTADETARTAKESIERLADRVRANGQSGPDAPLAGDTADEELVGALLFDVASLARMLGIDPEQALRNRAMAQRDRIRDAEGVPNPPTGNR
jgi:tetrapyrrole methylase family protein / MazG family protein